MPQYLPPNGLLAWRTATAEQQAALDANYHEPVPAYRVRRKCKNPKCQQRITHQAKHGLCRACSQNRHQRMKRAAGLRKARTQ